MKKSYSLLLLLVGLATQVTSQTLTYAAFLNSLSNSLNVKIANNASFNTALLTTTGTGVTWNASGLTQQSGTPLVQFIYTNPSSTPYASLFPNSNYAQYDPALTAFLNYEYYQLSPTAWENWGEYSPNTAHEIYSNSDKRLQFPFSYGNSFTDTYAKTNYSNATTVSSNQTGSRTVSFDGFGTLILPQGTFNNVGMIRELRTNSLGPNSTVVTWWDINNGKQLLYFSENNGNVNVAYNSDNPLSTEEMNVTDAIQISPNPSNGNFIIATRETAPIEQIVVYNSLGQTIYRNDQAQQTNEVRIPGAASGLCTVSIRTVNKTYVKKIMIQ